jgi:hypothetical protein
MSSTVRRCEEINAEISAGFQAVGSPLRELLMIHSRAPPGSLTAADNICELASAPETERDSVEKHERIIRGKSETLVLSGGFQTVLNSPNADGSRSEFRGVQADGKDGRCLMIDRAVVTLRRSGSPRERGRGMREGTD